MSIEAIIQQATIEAVKTLYGTEVNTKQVQVQNTRKEFSGDVTIVVFPFLRFSKKSPEERAKQIS